MPEHNLLTGSQLHEPFHFVSATDPGAVGAGKWWIQIPVDQSSVSIFRRNAANTAWISSGSGGDFTYQLTPPTGNTDVAAKNTISHDSTWLYIATAINSWKKTPLQQVVQTTFNWVSNGDINGYIYYRATSDGTVSWSNPHTLGNVTIVHTPLGIGITANFVDLVANNSYTNNVVNAFVGVDFGIGKSLKPNRFSMRARSGGNDNQPRNFKLQGTNSVSANTEAGWNAATWTDLVALTSDTSLNADSAWGSWVVSAVNYYRYLRIIQTGANSSGSNLFVLSEIEFYGLIP